MWVEIERHFQRFPEKRKHIKLRLRKCSPKEPFLRKPLSLAQKWKAPKTVLKTEGKRVGPTQGRHEELREACPREWTVSPKSFSISKGTNQTQVQTIILSSAGDP